MEKEEIVVGSPVVVAGVTLIPIARVSLNYWHVKETLAFFGTKRPVSIIVASALATRAFRISGEEVSLEQLMQEIPGIKATLEDISLSS